MKELQQKDIGRQSNARNGVKFNIYINSANSKGMVFLVWSVIIKNLARIEPVYQRHVLGSIAKSLWEGIYHMLGKR